MVKIRVINSNGWFPEDYVGQVFEAFKREWFDEYENKNFVAYMFQPANDYIVELRPPDCEEIEEVTQREEEKPSAPTSQILIVEDGSVDVDDLEEWCADNSIKLIVYRQGANKPEFLKY